MRCVSLSRRGRGRWLALAVGMAACACSAKAADASRDEFEPTFDEAFRPQLHFTAPKGWLNDPNGLVFVAGEWRLMYQHAMDAVSEPWNTSRFFWGYATSDDLVNWIDRGDAMLPPPGERKLISGSGVVSNGEQFNFVTCGGKLLLYRSRDGRSFTREEKPCPVEGHNVGGDPNVALHGPSKRWIMVTHGAVDGRWSVLFHSSANLRDWRYESTYAGDETKVGRWTYMHECPNLVEMSCGDETAWVLFCANGQCAVGNFDGRRFSPKAERLETMCKEKGERTCDRYAAQVFRNVPDGRVVSLGWLRSPIDFLDPKTTFNQSLSLPQELELKRKDGSYAIARRPARELAVLRDGEAVALKDFDGELIEAALTARVRPGGRAVWRLRGEALVYDADKGTLTMAKPWKREYPWPVKDGRVEIRVFMDRVGTEVFSEDGLLYAPFAAVCPDRNQRGISCEGVAADEVGGRAWRLKPLGRRTK